MKENEEENVKDLKENIRKNIQELQKGQKALEDAIKLLKVLDEMK